MKEFMYDIDDMPVSPSGEKFLSGQMSSLSERLRKVHQEVNEEIEKLHKEVDQLREYIKLPWYKKLRKHNIKHLEG